MNQLEPRDRAIPVSAKRLHYVDPAIVSRDPLICIFTISQVKLVEGVGHPDTYAQLSVFFR